MEIPFISRRAAAAAHIPIIFEKLSQVFPRFVYVITRLHPDGGEGIFMCACFAIFNGNLCLMLAGRRKIIVGAAVFSALLTPAENGIRANSNYFMRLEREGGDVRVASLELLYNEDLMMATYFSILCFRNFEWQ